jgi:hypothetical protein
VTRFAKARQNARQLARTWLSEAKARGRILGLRLLAAMAWMPFLLGAQVYAVVPTTAILANATVSSSGSLIVVAIPSSEVDLNWNISGSVSGTLPTIQFKITPVDPVNTGTSLTGDTVVTSASLNAAGTGELVDIPLKSSAVKVSWTVGGTLPSFGGVYLTLAIKNPLKI